MTPQEVIAQVTDEFLKDESNWPLHSRPASPHNINNGLCYEWAQEVLDRLQDSPHKVQLWEILLGFGDTSHAFVSIDGTFYDAEAPNGVPDHMLLPCLNGLPRQPVFVIDNNRATTAAQPPLENKRDVSDELLAEYNEENGIV
jgi:hypothetical protein